METPNTIVIHATGHPDLAVRRAGFPLDHPYVERCWTSALGPSGVLLLRRMPELFRQGTSVGVDVEPLARSLGLGAGRGRRGAIWRTMDRLCQMRFAEWSSPQELEVYTEVRPLGGRLLDRAPDGVRVAHDTLLAEHLDRLAAPERLTVVRPASTLARRLDHLQHATPSAHELAR
jgi:hypothetical protein